MDSAALSNIYGYGYDSGQLPYYYTYNPNYDFPIPNWIDPRWKPKQPPIPTVYASQVQVTGPFGQIQKFADNPVPLELSEASPVGSIQKWPFLFLGVVVLLFVLIGALDVF